MSRSIHKLELWDEAEDPFVLIAIHATTAPYRLAYMINKYLGYTFQREERDQDVVMPDFTAQYPVFKYVDHTVNVNYYLTPNKYWTQLNSTTSSNGLFESNEPEVIKTVLVKEYSTTDYLIKIEQEQEYVPVKKMVAELMKIPLVISAYPLDTNQIKQKDYLIFE